MSVENRRGCGFRKVGGLYLVGSGFGIPCNALPMIVEACPVCNCGIKYSRGWRWVIPKLMFAEQLKKVDCSAKCLAANDCPFKSEKREGLMWVGQRFYTPEKFIEESKSLGISKRIATVPKGFKVGKTWVLLAHKQASRDTFGVLKPAVFYVFRPSAIEKIVTQSDFDNNLQEMTVLKKRGITPVAVPDNDADHRGTVYDDALAEAIPKPNSLFD